VLGPKRLDILNELIPAAKVAVLVNSSDPPARVELETVQTGAQARGQQLLVLPANTEEDIENAFALIIQHGAGSLFVGAGAYFTARRDQIIRLAAHHRIPTIYQQREFVQAGGLISYGISFTNQYRELGIYTTRVLKGTKPADLPVQQPTKFELVINLKTAKVLGLTVPLTLQASADEVDRVAILLLHCMSLVLVQSVIRRARGKE